MIIGGGAFQDYHRGELGADVMFEEQIQQLPPLTFENLIAAGHLPDKLVNRLGSVVEIRPPSATEISERMTKIENDAEIVVPREQRETKAREIAVGMARLRGLGLYALQIAKTKHGGPTPGA